MSSASSPPPPGTGAPPDTPSAAAATAQSRGDEPPGGGPDEPCADADPLDPRPPIAYELGDRVKQAATIRHFDRKPDDPIYRPLKIYTIDPSRHREEGQTAEINIPYETIEKGPVGYRFAVKNGGYGPFGDYDPVDLNAPNLLIANGRDPAPTDRIFHHQMVYAVAMSTYAVFRTALGRQISWAFPGEHLTLVPHAFEGANAYYARDEKALSFGWYRVEGGDNIDMPADTIIYTCLSHDIIVHELTHALLDGLRVQFNVATNADVSAFHEAFADLVALLLRFSYSTVVQNIILQTNGDLKKEDSDWLHLVFELARGQGERSLRGIDLQGVRRYDADAEMHELGTVLVSAIIDAFVTIYTRKAEPVMRMATGRRNGLAEDQAMSGDLLASLTHIASRLASHLLTMCIRAIDYCPPVDITLGEYLRALITADRDLVPDDPWSYREALVDAFRKRHIFPGGVDALTEDALLWRPPERPICIKELKFDRLHFAGGPGRAAGPREAQRQATAVAKAVCKPANLAMFGLADPADPAGYEGDVLGVPKIESVRTSRRVGPDGQLSFDLIAEVVQCRKFQRPGLGEFEFFGGATLIFGADGHIRYVIAKSITSDKRIERQRLFVGKGDVVVHALDRCRYQKQPDKPGGAKASSTKQPPKDGE